MSNNTSIDPIEHKSVKVKTGNMCKVRNHLTNLYKKYGIVAEAINLIIGEDDDTPTIIDNLSETIEKVRNIDGIEVSHLGKNHVTDPFSFSDYFVRLNWDCYNLGESNEPTSHSAPIPVASRLNAGILNSDDYKKLDNIGEYTNIYHTGGSSGHTLTWSGDDSNVYLLFSNTNPSNKNTTEYNAITNKQAFPVASTTKAGIITAEMYRNLNNWFSKDQCSENKINTYEEVLDFLDGVENTHNLRDIYIFEGHVNAQDFSILDGGSFVSIALKDLIFWCHNTTYVIDGGICRDVHFYGRNGRELIPEELEPVVFLITDQEGITYLNEIEGEPVTDVVFKTSSSSDVSWGLEALRQRIGFITNTDGPRGLADASTLFSQNNTINIARRASFPIPLLSRLTGITNRLTTVELTSTSLGNDKVNIAETVPYGQGNIKTTIYRDANAALDIKLEYRKRLNDNTNLGLVDIRDLVIISTEDSSNGLASCITVLPASITLDGGDVTIKGENDVNICSQSGQTSNASITVSESTGLYELYLNPTEHITSLINLGDNTLISSGIVNSSVAQIGLGIDETNSNKPLVNAEVTTYSNNVATTQGLQINSDESKLYNSNISITLNNSTGLKINFSDGSYVLYKNDGTQESVYNLNLTLNYLDSAIIKGGYIENSGETHDNILSIILPFYIKSGISGTDIIGTDSGLRSHDYLYGVTREFKHFKIYKTLTEGNPCYFLIGNNSPQLITSIEIGGGLGQNNRNKVRFISQPEVVNVTISSAEYSTFYYSDKAFIIPEGITASTIIFEMGNSVPKITETPLSGIIPAGVPVLLNGNEGTYEFIVSPSTITFDGRNDLIGTDEGGTVGNDGATYYVLTLNGNNEAGFYWYGESNLGDFAVVNAHKAYIRYEAPSNNP